jgi:long-chain-fatty-acid--CoA ligase ACSBG
MFFFGAAPLKRTSIDYFASLDIPLLNMYGMSETCGAVTAHTLSRFSLTGCGFPMPSMDIKIDNPNEKGNGEICMKGRFIMMGYLKNEKATIETIDEEGYLRSGDQGRFDERGFLMITGRIKELIITAGGENVAPVIIEDNFKETCPMVSNVIVFGEMQKYLTALVTFKVDMDPASGEPTRNLTIEAKNGFKRELGIDINTSDEAVSNEAVVKYVT